jgi:hypothetical protein
VAAVENDEEGGVWREVGDKMLVQYIRIYLALLTEIDGTDGVEETGGMVSCGILDLTTVARVMEEVTSSRFADEPIYGGLCLFGQLIC